jgi:hypothetical protein
MSIPSISSVSSYQANQVNWQNNSTQRQSAFQALASALQAGNLSSAQQAFAALQQSQPNFSATAQAQNAQQASVQDPLAVDFSALDKALKANNLQAAKDAFAKLLQDMQSVKGHPHHHHKASASTQSTASTTSSPSVVSTTGSGQNGSAGGSINISV